MYVYMHICIYHNHIYIYISQSDVYLQIRHQDQIAPSSDAGSRN